MPGATDHDKCLKKLCEMETLHVRPDFVNVALHAHTEATGSNELQGALLAAVACDETEVFTRLLGMGADVDTETSWRIAMGIAAQAGSINIMTILLGNTNASNFNKDERGNVIGSPLTLAARYGHVDISKLLVSSTIYW
jgi:hypothetical protein